VTVLFLSRFTGPLFRELYNQENIAISPNSGPDTKEKKSEVFSRHNVTKLSSTRKKLICRKDAISFTGPMSSFC
jgi:hypothetical protein